MYAEVKTFQEKHNLSQFMAAKPVQQKTLMGALYPGIASTMRTQERINVVKETDEPRKTEKEPTMSNTIQQQMLDTNGKERKEPIVPAAREQGKELQKLVNVKVLNQ